MKYYVIGDPDRTIAVIFHDYVSANFLVYSKTESFRLAFDSAVSLYSKVNFTKKGSKLKFNTFGPQFLSWSTFILGKICNDFWKVTNQGNIAGEAFVDGIVEKFLN